MNDTNLDYFFKPKSIALVGLPRGVKAGTVFLLGLLDQGFSGPIYPVHPQAEEIGGLRAYPRLTDIPGPVDMAIVMAPQKAVEDILEQCGKKKVKAVVMYTSGFGEAGEEGRKDEERILEIAGKGGFRILGPNCMGIYSPSGKLAFFSGMPRREGRLGFISQSGSIANIFTYPCAARRVFFRHVVSYGNGADVDLPELLDYMGDDPGVGIIGAYCEGVRDGRALADAMRRVSGKKPVIMWKVGDTEAGQRAAASHTGSMSGSETIWSAVFKQFGIIDVNNIEELLDVVMAFYHLPGRTRGRVAIISGPGGPAVSAADAAHKYGLEMATLSKSTTKKLASFIPPTGTSLKNPIDVGLGASFDLRLYLDSLEAVVNDDKVDATLVLGGGISRDTNEIFIKGLIERKRQSGKAVIAISYPGFEPEDDLVDSLYDAGIPVYPTPERALFAYAKVVQYHRFVKSRGVWGS